MRSHEYQIRLREWVRAVGPTLLVIAGLAVLLKAANYLALLPAPALAWDPELTVLAHQSAACHDPEPAEILITGDSTCLAGVDARDLSRELPARPRVLSLALFVWLGLDVYAELVSDYAEAHPGHIRAVVLLTTTTKLTETNETEDGAAIWRRVHPKKGHGVGADEAGLGPDWLGARTLRRHLLSHCLATPLRGSGADFFGFSSEIEAYLTTHRGSLPTFGTALPLRRPASGPPPAADSVLAPAQEKKSRAFRANMPPGTKLFIGLMPAMADTSSPEARRRRDALLRQWNIWIEADALLTNLPPTLPSVFFSPGAHLNQPGQKVFTRLLAREMAPLLGADP
jgi:hypothetical protein